MTREFFLKENVLTDNILLVPNKGKIFKGGYIGIVKEYKYQNQWSDKEIIKKFRNANRLNDYIFKNYPDVEIDFTDTCLETK